jgi:hypothetical protein
MLYSARMGLWLWYSGCSAAKVTRMIKPVEPCCLYRSPQPMPRPRPKPTPKLAPGRTASTSRGIVNPCYANTSGFLVAWSAPGSALGNSSLAV